jgi:hypothetical protein
VRSIAQVVNKTVERKARKGRKEESPGILCALCGLRVQTSCS